MSSTSSAVGRTPRFEAGFGFGFGFGFGGPGFRIEFEFFLAAVLNVPPTRPGPGPGPGPGPAIRFVSVLVLYMALVVCIDDVVVLHPSRYRWSVSQMGGCPGCGRKIPRTRLMASCLSGSRSVFAYARRSDVRMDATCGEAGDIYIYTCRTVEISTSGYNNNSNNNDGDRETKRSGNVGSGYTAIIHDGFLRSGCV